MGNGFIDLTGNRFGRLIVLEKRGYKKYPAGGSSALWFVRCDCGVEKIVLGVNLRNGGSQSCGCLLKEHRERNGKKWALPPGVSSRNRILDYYKRGANTRSLPWSISDDLFDFLIKRPCHWCGSPPLNPELRSHESFKHSNTPDAEFLYNGIDRKDNTYGYIVGNVVSCCRLCNWMKGSLDWRDFVLQARKIAAHDKSKTLIDKNRLENFSERSIMFTEAIDHG
jgi:hypothetical protein